MLKRRAIIGTTIILFSVGAAVGLEDFAPTWLRALVFGIGSGSGLLLSVYLGTQEDKDEKE